MVTAAQLKRAASISPQSKAFARPSETTAHFLPNCSLWVFRKALLVNAARLVKVNGDLIIISHPVRPRWSSKRRRRPHSGVRSAQKRRDLCLSHALSDLSVVCFVGYALVQFAGKP